MSFPTVPRPERCDPITDRIPEPRGTGPTVVEHSAADESLRDLVDRSPALIAIAGSDGRILHLNPAFLDTFDQTLDDLVGRGADDLMPDGRRSDLAATAAAVRATGEPRDWQGQLPHPRGHAVDLLGHVFPLPLTDGSTGIGAVLIDVTDREQARRELVESERHYRAIFDAAEISVLLLDLDARIVDANAAAIRLSGRGRGELRGRFVGIVTTRGDTRAYRQLWTDLLEGRRSRLDVDISLRHLDGARVPARLTVTLIRDHDGQPYRALFLAIPFTGRTQDTLSAPVDRALTSAEAAVLARLAAGRSLQQIADDLGLTRRGVDYRVSQLRRKLRANGPAGVPATGAGLVARAYALGIIHPSTWPPRVDGVPNASTGLS